jgi:hypothetical protein
MEDERASGAECRGDAADGLAPVAGDDMFLDAWAAATAAAMALVLGGSGRLAEKGSSQLTGPPPVVVLMMMCVGSEASSRLGRSPTAGTVRPDVGAGVKRCVSEDPGTLRRL